MAAAAPRSDRHATLKPAGSPNLTPNPNPNPNPNPDPNPDPNPSQVARADRAAAKEWSNIEANRSPHKHAVAGGGAV